MVSSIALTPDKQNEDKHVESKLLPCLDEGSTPSNSTELYKLLKISNKKLLDCLLNVCQTFNRQSFFIYRL